MGFFLERYETEPSYPRDGRLELELGNGGLGMKTTCGLEETISSLVHSFS